MSTLQFSIKTQKPGARFARVVEYTPATVVVHARGPMREFTEQEMLSDYAQDAL